MARLLFALVIGLGGLVILLSLGTWQVQRLREKQALIAEINATIAAPPVALPQALDPDKHRYLPISITGEFRQEPIARMLASRRQIGAVYRVLAPFDTQNGRSLIIDLGWIPTDAPWPTREHTSRIMPVETLELIGNLDWPREVDGFTPEPDLEKKIWYARSVDSLATSLDTEPVLMVLRTAPPTELGITPWPVDTGNIPNDHLQYAITWFSLAAIWAGMSIFFLRGSRRRQT